MPHHVLVVCEINIIYLQNYTRQRGYIDKTTYYKKICKAVISAVKANACDGHSNREIKE